MTQEQIEGTKIIAKYKSLVYGGAGIPVETYNFHASWDRQIPVWQKVVIEVDSLEPFQSIHPLLAVPFFSIIKAKYLNTINYQTPAEGFKILVQAIQWLQTQKQK